MKKYNAITKEEMFRMFDIYERQQIIDTLKAFNEVNVTFENGRHHIFTGMMLKNKYAEDYKFIGTIYADDIFSAEERMINYVESFHSYPAEYKGRRDYRMLNAIGNDWSVKFKFDDGGNIVIA